jgi:hypothetical protein
VTAAGQDPRGELDRLVRRLRGFSPRAWRADGRVESVSALLGALAALEGRPAPAVPGHALADAVAVLGHDALDAGHAERVGELVAEALRRTR